MSTKKISFGILVLTLVVALTFSMVEVEEKGEKKAGRGYRTKV